MLNDVLGGVSAAALSGGGFMDALPDPMKLDIGQVLFVMAVLTVLYLVLRAMFFKPVLTTIDAREAAMEAGAAKRAEAADLLAQRQAAYDARLQELRMQAFDHRKALATAAADERQRLLQAARTAAAGERAEALARLTAQREAAKSDLVRQVDDLADSMVQHLLKA